MKTLKILSLLPTIAMAHTAERPNVILILADDLGWGDLSCYGATRVNTPCVDDIANHGIRFTNAHAVASTSTPSRYGLLTGSYPFRKHGTDVAAGNVAMIISPQQFTLADVFHNAGYHTAAIGKWHLGLGSKTGEQDWNASLDQTPCDLGFDYHYIMAATADRVPCVFVEQGRVVNYDSTAPIEISYRQPFAGEPLGSTNPELLTKQQSSHGHDMAIVNGIGRIGYMKGGGKALWRDEDIADTLVASTQRYIEQNANSDRPFFLYLCTNDIHVPRQPNERFRDKSPMGLRGEAILQFDWTVGQITATLKRLGIYDNTLIIITSDNGPVLDDGYCDQAEELCGNHRPGGPFRGGKYSAFEAGNAIPFIVSWPNGIGVKQRESDRLVSQIDFVASMNSLLGGTLPEGASTDSRNCLKTWLGKSSKPAPFHISMAANRSLEIRTQRWKYITPSKGDSIISWGPRIETGYSLSPQLYDMKANVGETNNKANAKPNVVQKMQALLQNIVGQ